MDRPLFGPSGNSIEFYQKYNKTLDEPKYLKELGLDAFEYSFGRGFTMSSATGQIIGDEFKKHGIALTLHAPYFINFANLSDKMALKSYGYLLTGIKFLKAMQAVHLTFHIASQGNLERSDAIALTQKRLDKFIEQVINNKLLDSNQFLCPETMGKQGQIGTYKEIIDFCKSADFLKPTFDFGHINALTQGGLKTADDYKRVFDYCFEVLGEEKTKNCHIHFSKIQYTAKGEKVHLNFDDDVHGFGPDFEPLAEVLCEYKLTPIIICESAGHMSNDALTMKKIYDCQLKKY